MNLIAIPCFMINHLFYTRGWEEEGNKIRVHEHQEQCLFREWKKWIKRNLKIWIRKESFGRKHRIQLKRPGCFHGSSLPQINLFPRLHTQHRSTTDRQRSRERDYHLILCIALHSIIVVRIAIPFIRRNLGLPIEIRKSLTPTCKSPHVTQRRRSLVARIRFFLRRRFRFPRVEQHPLKLRSPFLFLRGLSGSGGIRGACGHRHGLRPALFNVLFLVLDLSHAGDFGRCGLLSFDAAIPGFSSSLIGNHGAREEAFAGMALELVIPARAEGRVLECHRCSFWQYLQDPALQLWLFILFLHGFKSARCEEKIVGIRRDLVVFISNLKLSQTCEG